MVDAGIFTLVQTTFLQHIDQAFSVVSAYATHLLYFFAVFEVVIFGLLWAFSANSDWGTAVFKIIKIGLLFFILSNFSILMNELIRSFAQIGGDIANTQKVNNLLFNPSLVWQYGYNAGLVLLKSASVASGGIGFPLVLILLGSGILLVFGLLGIQIVLQIAGFYLVALTAMIFIPFGVFNPASKFFSRAVQSVFKAGVRVMAIIVVLGLMIVILAPFKLENIKSIAQINQPLGIFFAGLLFFYFAIKLPSLLSEVIGEFVLHEGVQTVVIPSSGFAPSVSVSAITSPLSPMQQATSIQPGTGSPMQMGAAMGGGGTTATQVSQAGGIVAVQPGSAQAKSPQAEKALQKGFQDAAKIQRSISEQSLKEIKKLIKEKLTKEL